MRHLDIARTLKIWVLGVPVPQGSHTKNRAGAIYDQAKGLKSWRRTVHYEAVEIARCSSWRCAMDEPVHLAMIFYLPRGKTVIRAEPTTRPDLSKLVRAVEDALRLRVLERLLQTQLRGSGYAFDVHGPMEPRPASS